MKFKNTDKPTGILKLEIPFINLSIRITKYETSWPLKFEIPIQCVNCNKKIKGKVQRTIMYATKFGPMHHECGKLLSHAEKYGGKFLPTVEEERRNNKKDYCIRE